ncbi:UNVERIFIED_CONTAM: hypothetical protein FKN15_038722 [Acipenser sinensis]
MAVGSNDLLYHELCFHLLLFKVSAVLSLCQCVSFSQGEKGDALFTCATQQPWVSCMSFGLPVGPLQSGPGGSPCTGRSHPPASAAAAAAGAPGEAWLRGELLAPHRGLLADRLLLAAGHFAGGFGAGLPGRRPVGLRLGFGCEEGGEVQVERAGPTPRTGGVLPALRTGDPALLVQHRVQLPQAVLAERVPAVQLAWETLTQVEGGVADDAVQLVARTRVRGGVRNLTQVCLL